MSNPYITMSYKTVFIRHFIMHENGILSVHTISTIKTYL